MSIAFTEYLYFKNLRSRDDFLQMTFKFHDANTFAICLLLEEIAEKKIFNDDKKGHEFLLWLLVQTFDDYCLFLFNEDGIILVPRPGLNGMIHFALCKPTPGSVLEDRERVIELKSLVSLQKGEGFKMMCDILSIAKRLQLPVFVWAEDKHQAEYFERYTFRNCGPLGEDRECLMLLDFESEGKR